MRDVGNQAVVCVALHEGTVGHAFPPADGIVVFIGRSQDQRTAGKGEITTERCKEGAEAEERIA
jgi:hypothetical protein